MKKLYLSLFIIFLASGVAYSKAYIMNIPSGNFDAEGHNIVEYYEAQANLASNQKSCKDHTWMIELGAREIEHAHGGAATQTVHWMRTKMGEINHYCNGKPGGGGNIPTCPIGYFSCNDAANTCCKNDVERCGVGRGGTTVCVANPW